MTLTFSVPVKRLPGQLVETQTQVTIDATYATGGIALTPQQLGHRERRRGRLRQRPHVRGQRVRRHARLHNPDSA